MRIKLSYYFAKEPLLRQTPAGRGSWKAHHFLANNSEAQECDIWVVLEDPAEESELAFVESGRAILVTLEPQRKREYPPSFLAQFDLVVSCHRNLLHPNVRNDCQGYSWHIGLNKGWDANRSDSSGTMGYDEFLNMAPPRKTRALSVICSTKSGLPGHRLRLRFVEKLQERLGGRIDVFGRGVRPVPDKAEAIMPYRYHIALENSTLPDYWTEKLADSYLGWSFPIYWGCPNIGDYFGPNSLAEIDINRPDEAIGVIKSMIDQELTAEQAAGLAAARALVLDRYNIFDVVCRACESLSRGTPREIVIRSQRSFRPSKVRRLLGRVLDKLSFAPLT